MFFVIQRNRLTQLAYNRIPILLTMFLGFLFTVGAVPIAFTTSNVIVKGASGMAILVYFFHFALSSGSPTDLTPTQERMDRQNGFTGFAGGILWIIIMSVVAILFWIF